MGHKYPYNGAYMGSSCKWIMEILFFSYYFIFLSNSRLNDFNCSSKSLAAIIST